MARALDWQSRGRRFEPALLHLPKSKMKKVLIFFLFLNISCSPFYKYSTTNKEFENEIANLEALDVDQIAGQNELLFIGSSSIRMWDNIKEDMAPFKSVNRGYGGAHYYDLIHFTKRLVVNHSPKAILIFVANDITGSNNETNTIGDLSPKKVRSLFKFCYTSIREVHKNIPIFLIETTPTPKRWNVWGQISKANDMLKKVCEQEENLYFISTRNKFINKNNLPIKSLFLDDELHLNREGYKLWSRIIKSNLFKVFI